MVRGEQEVCGNSSSGEEASKSKSWLAACKRAAVCRLIWQAGGSVCSAVQKGGAGGAAGRLCGARLSSGGGGLSTP